MSPVETTVSFVHNHPGRILGFVLVALLVCLICLGFSLLDDEPKRRK